MAEDGVSFDDKMEALTTTLNEQMQKAVSLDNEIKKNLNKIGFPLE
jgi:type I restriction enzyme M protein